MSEGLISRNTYFILLLCLNRHIAMKKLYLFTITMLSVVYLSAQVKDFTVVSSKEYENNTRTSYLELNADLDIESALVIEKELEQNADFSRFSFYTKQNLSK